LEDYGFEAGLDLGGFLLDAEYAEDVPVACGDEVTLCGVVEVVTVVEEGQLCFGMEDGKGCVEAEGER
jgi:hypothetical protein